MNTSTIPGSRRYFPHHSDHNPDISMPSTETNISRLLLCSSDTTKLQPLRQRLIAAGVEVDCASEADKARELLWNRHYDGVALDLLLADRDGNHRTEQGNRGQPGRDKTANNDEHIHIPGPCPEIIRRTGKLPERIQVCPPELHSSATLQLFYNGCLCQQ